MCKLLVKEEKELSKKSLGNYVREQRLKAGYKKIQPAATKAGVDRAYWSRLEAGKDTGSIDSLKQVADALSIPLSFLINAYFELPPESSDIDPEALTIALGIINLPLVSRQHIERQLKLLQIIRLEDLDKLTIAPIPPANTDLTEKRARDHATFAEKEKQVFGEAVLPTKEPEKEPSEEEESKGEETEKGIGRT